ncbi:MULTISPECIES: hypothetical protein [unclassified Streptomyces]|uniref:DUF7848 domain-containing protein n=1 Tax=unclassified Streptomyces TaxID=2593676 RepID=UPI00225842B7|nr:MULTISPECIES: hypothetical protein [unclassified Streptomyces]MCX4866885.1 hypothetical protein [Streptomyces sp. NBC_00906]MCX4898123.1 hypothetical protein [Streptomyces sp. NBC_00892]
MTAVRLRAAHRYALHRITEHPDTDTTFEAECLWCSWAAEPSTESASVDVECLIHTGLSGHESFRRVRTSFAVVVRG